MTKATMRMDNATRNILFEENKLSPRVFVLVLYLLLMLLIPLQSFADTSSTPTEKLTVLDKKSGLMWQVDDSYHELKKGLNWYDAQEYLERKNMEKYAGYSDWRLPKLEELNALWDSSLPLKSKDGEAIGLSSQFQGGGSYYLWTSSERGLDNVWYFGLGQKENYFNLKDLADLEQGVKMVRGQTPQGK